MRYVAFAGLLVASVIGASTPVELLAQDEPTELDPITVTPPYLYEGDRQLSRLRSNLPDMGDSPVAGVLAAIRKLYEKRKDPNNLDPFQQSIMLRALGEGEDF